MPDAALQSRGDLFYPAAAARSSQRDGPERRVALPHRRAAALKAGARELVLDAGQGVRLQGWLTSQTGPASARGLAVLLVRARQLPWSGRRDLPVRLERSGPASSRECGR